MFDNPQNKVNTTSKKLRPIKMSDEEFELFYKEIYAEFGPKDVAPVDLIPQVQVEVPAEPQVEEAPQVVEAEPVVEEVPLEPVAEEVPVEPVEEEIPQEVPAEPVFAPVAEEVQENSMKAAAVICDVQEDELLEEMEEIPVPKKSKGVPALVVILCLEALAIAGVAAYWLLMR